MTISKSISIDSDSNNTQYFDDHISYKGEMNSFGPMISHYYKKFKKYQ